MNLILLGAPNSGKGSLAKDLCSILSISQLSTGEMFRRLVRENNPEGIRARDEYWGRGNLVPDEQTIKLVELMLQKEEYKKGAIFDGFPRTIPQAERLDKLISDYSVLSLEASREILIERSKNRRFCEFCQRGYNLISIPPKVEGKCDVCPGSLIQRQDDLFIEERLVVYERQTKPLLEYYKSKLFILDANKSMKEVTQQALSYLIK
jgi:adenylate kinase